VVLDLHGDITGYKAALEISAAVARLRANPNAVLVFVGDYLDKNVSQLLLLPLLVALKAEFPKQVVLLRGNHEVSRC
jgi:protein phosphatase